MTVYRPDKSGAGELLWSAQCCRYSREPAETRDESTPGLVGSPHVTSPRTKTPRSQRDAFISPPFPQESQTPSHPFGGSAILGSFVACEAGVAEEARTRGFAPPAFAGFASVAGALLAAT